MTLAGVSFHVEAIEVEETNRNNEETIIKVVNKDYENRLDAYYDLNDGVLPSLVELEGKKYLIHIEPYSSRKFWK